MLGFIVYHKKCVKTLWNSLSPVANKSELVFQEGIKQSIRTDFTEARCVLSHVSVCACMLHVLPEAECKRDTWSMTCLHRSQ